MRIAYARVSTTDQSLDLQIDALKAHGYDRIFTDHGVSGISADRSGLREAMSVLQEGDTFIVWRLDRLARSMRDLTDTVESLNNRGIRFISLCEYIDVNSAFGELILHILSAVAHFERALLVERTRAGMAAAKERGKTFGRRPALNGEEFCEALFLIDGGMSIPKAAQQIGVGRSTLYRYVSDHQAL